ncbi:inactive receptor kinase [Artemisia annua]|uniref:Inactive receptor kinase n=1 Tax=Artemisia annua TaxID=35608 RepID=A0A2U1LPN9_ARTAN|nr:inactive receptor kinase [Artemisia annua]
MTLLCSNTGKSNNEELISVTLGDFSALQAIKQDLVHLSTVEDMEAGLHDNLLSGVIPQSLWLLPNLRGPYLFNNRLSGSIPPSVTPSLQNLDLSNNQLNGSMAPSPTLFRILVKYVDLTLVTMLFLVPFHQVLPFCRSSPRKKSAARSKSKNTETDVSMAVPPVAGAEVVESRETGRNLVHFSGPFVFTADDLLCETAEIMGKSTYGTSYKATLEDGNMVAVKRPREKVTKAHMKTFWPLERITWELKARRSISKWAESIATAAKKGRHGQQELDWDSYEKIIREMALQKLQRSADVAKAKEMAQI